MGVYKEISKMCCLWLECDGLARVKPLIFSCGEVYITAYYRGGGHVSFLVTVTILDDSICSSLDHGFKLRLRLQSLRLRLLRLLRCEFIFMNIKYDILLFIFDISFIF